MALIEKVCLYYREGTSDKLYEIHLTQEDEGFCVTGYNGRRGTKLVAQPKTPKPVPLRTARYIFDNLEAAKLNHRRTPYRVGSRETPTLTNGATVATAPLAEAKQMIAPSDANNEYQADWVNALEFQ